MYKIPVFYLKWFFGPSILKPFTIKEVDEVNEKDPLQ